MGKRSKRRANLNQTLSCLNRVKEDLESAELPFSNDEWFTFYACAATIGRINAIHFSRKLKGAKSDADN